MSTVEQIGRLVLSPPADGAWNMALDQALFEGVQVDGVPVLRFYHWKQPTISLGYFQRVSQRQEHHSSQKLELVRRSTGGGAIVHDRELTYSLCLPANNRFGAAALAIYNSVHLAIVRAGLELGFELQRFADLHPTDLDHRLEDVAAMSEHKAEEPFLCFQRRTDEDLILSGYKIVGSAQRRSAGALLQHGSILLAASPSAPELPGVVELLGRPVNAQILCERVTEQLSKELKIIWKDWAVPPGMIAAAQSISQRFSSNDWTLRRS